MKPTDCIRTSIELQANEAVAPGYGALLNMGLAQEEAVIEVAEGENPERDSARAVAEVASMLGDEPIDVLQDAATLLE